MVGFSYAQRWQRWVAELDYRHVLTVATLLILPLFLRPQGIDLTDLGYAASNAQQFFDHPENIGGPGQLYWLSNLLSALCLWFFKFPGIPLLGLKIGHALCIYAILYLTYRLLRNDNHKKETLGGLVLCLLFATGSTKSWLNYNIISSLLLVCSAYSLYVGLFRESLFGLVVSGLVAGLSAFARLPNLLTVIFCRCSHLLGRDIWPQFPGDSCSGSSIRGGLSSVHHRSRWVDGQLRSSRSIHGTPWIGHDPRGMGMGSRSTAFGASRNAFFKTIL